MQNAGTAIVRAIALGMGVALVSTAASADVIEKTYTPPSPYEEMDDLDHHKAYEWNFELGLVSGAKIISAELVLTDIYNWEDGDNDLYIHLLEGDALNLGVTEYDDIDDPFPPDDYFAGQGIELVVYHDLPDAPPQTLTHPFSAGQLTILNNYAADDVIGLGFDPDCHLCNSGVELRVTTPEPASAALLLLSGVPVLLSRRRRQT